MSVDKFGRHDSTVRARKEVRRTLSEDIGLRVSDDGNFDVENKRILNVGEPYAANDAVPLHYVDDRCLLIPTQNGSGGGGVDLKGNRIVNAGTPVDLKDLANKYYVDDKCLQFRKDNGNPIIDAHGFRLTSLKDPLQARDAANKRYVDVKSLPKDQFGNVSVRDHRITDVQDPLMNKDAVNLMFLHFNTVSLQDEVFHAHGRKICNVMNGEAKRDVVNMQQLDELKLYIRSEMYKVTSILKNSVTKLWQAMYDIHSNTGVHIPDNKMEKSSVKFSEDYKEVTRTITILDKDKEIYDWRYLYDGKNEYKLKTQ